MKIKKLKIYAMLLSFLTIIPLTKNVSGLSSSNNGEVKITNQSNEITTKSHKRRSSNNETENYDDYLEPVYGKYITSDVQTYSDDSKKDIYEDNNSFESATNITGWTSIEATLHKDPWYYLFWRDIDEDYYRVDVSGDANIKISLTNIPEGCDYDIELYTHSNQKNAVMSNIVKFDKESCSDNKGNMDEYLEKDITPNTYYIRVYSGDKVTYDANNKYKLTVLVDYKAKDKEYGKLRYNLGAGGAIWLSDFDPIGIKAFSTLSKEEAGFMLIEDSGLITNAFSNPIISQLEANKKIEHATIYIWNNNWKKALYTIVEEIRSQISKEVKDGQELRATLEFIGDKIETGGLIVGLVLTFFTPAGMSILTQNIISVISSVAPYVYAPLMKALFPNAWDTTKEKYLNYLNILSTALNTTDNTSDNEIVKISSYYKLTSYYDVILDRINYYFDFTPEYDETGYKYNDTTFYSKHQNQSFNGQIYGIVNSTDLSSIINRTFVAQSEINTGGNRRIELGNGIIDELDVGEYHWYNFTAPEDGYYRFYTEGTTDTYGSLFNEIVPSRSVSSEISSNDEDGYGSNFSLEYKMFSNQTIFIRVSGSFWDSIGEYHFKVEKMTGVHEDKDKIVLSDYGFKEKYESEPIKTSHITPKGLHFTTNRLRCGIIDKSYLVLSAKRKDAGLSYIEYEFNKVINTVGFDMAIWSNEEYLNQDSSISFDYKASNGKWRRAEYIDIAELSKAKESLDRFYIDFPEDAYGFRFVVRTNAVNYEKNKGRVVIGDISVFYLDS